MTRFLAEHAWLGGGQAEHDVLLEVVDGRFTRVVPGVRDPGAVPLRGLTLPGFANAHSHAFHRALRGRTSHGPGDFWTWREQMYAVADRLTPDSCYRLTRAAYAEMALAGTTCVGEFHYVHARPDGRAYDDPNAMGEAVLAAAADVGLRLTLLDTCYLAAGFDRPLAGPQRRFGDGSGQAWAERVAALHGAPTARIGAALHSVRAVPRRQMDPVVAWAAAAGAPLHVHLSEQPAENDACLAAHGCTPTALLADAGALGPSTTAVHATHLGDADVALLAGSGTGVCMCPTTERDLADGIGPARALAGRGVPLSLGSDSQAVIDQLEEARALELDERLASGRRGSWAPAELLHAATGAGCRSLGWPTAGRLEPGAEADFVTVSLDGVRLAGADRDGLLAAVVMAGTAADVREVHVAGRRLDLDPGQVARDLADAVAAVSAP